VALKLIFLIVSRAISLLRLSRREQRWKDAEILMLRHQGTGPDRDRRGRGFRYGDALPGRAGSGRVRGAL
jgi:hypothetical protein